MASRSQSQNKTLKERIKRGREGVHDERKKGRKEEEKGN
jgi:hypothetical protein